MRYLTVLEAMKIKEVPLYHNTCALIIARNSGSDQAMKVSQGRITNGKAFGNSCIISRDIGGTEVIPNNSWNGIAQVIEALLVLRASSEIRSVKAIMDTKFHERELKTVIPKLKLDGIRLVKSCRMLLERECGQEFKEEVSE